MQVAVALHWDHHFYDGINLQQLEAVNVPITGACSSRRGFLIKGTDGCSYQPSCYPLACLVVTPSRCKRCCTTPTSSGLSNRVFARPLQGQDQVESSTFTAYSPPTSLGALANVDSPSTIVPFPKYRIITATPKCTSQYLGCKASGRA